MPQILEWSRTFITESWSKQHACIYFKLIGWYNTKQTSDQNENIDKYVWVLLWRAHINNMNEASHSFSVYTQCKYDNTHIKTMTPCFISDSRDAGRFARVGVEVGFAEEGSSTEITVYIDRADANQIQFHSKRQLKKDFPRGHLRFHPAFSHSHYGFVKLFVFLFLVLAPSSLAD